MERVDSIASAPVTGAVEEEVGAEAEFELRLPVPPRVGRGGCCILTAAVEARESGANAGDAPR